MDAKEQLVRLLSRCVNRHADIARIADDLLAAGWTPPAPKPEEGLMEKTAIRMREEVAKVIPGINLKSWSETQKQDEWLATSFWHLREKLRAELAAVRERCWCMGGNGSPCKGDDCTPCCRNVRNAILARYPAEVREGVE